MQDTATSEVQVVPTAGRMDFPAVTDLLERLTEVRGIKVHAPVLALAMDDGSAHASRCATAWLREHRGIGVVDAPVHASRVDAMESEFGICARQPLRGAVSTSRQDRDAQDKPGSLTATAQEASQLRPRPRTRSRDAVKDH